MDIKKQLIWGTDLQYVRESVLCVVMVVNDSSDQGSGHLGEAKGHGT